MPSRPAIASRCTTAFVEPPVAAIATIALWNDSLVMTSPMVRPSRTRSTASRPVRMEASISRESVAGVPAVPGSVMPSASAMIAIVDAVPMVLQWPLLRTMERSLFRNASCESVPARTSSLSCQTPVPQPMRCPRNIPFIIGPPGTTTAGMPTEAAAISSAGIVLSQPPSSTRPSIGLARNISSIAIAAMLRQSIAVGRTSVSPSDTTGRSRPTPPASATPRFTAAEISSRCMLQGVRSEAVFAIAIWGRLPSNASSGEPRRIHARWM